MRDGDDGALKRLTPLVKRSYAAWLEGTWLAVAANRDGQPRLFKIPIDGGQMAALKGPPYRLSTRSPIDLESWPPQRRPRTHCPPFTCEYTMLTNRSALVPAAPAGKSPPGTFAS